LRVVAVDELAIGGLLVLSGEIDEAVEELAAVAAGTAVEAEDELVEVGLKPAGQLTGKPTSEMSSKTRVSA